MENTGFVILLRNKYSLRRRTYLLTLNRTISFFQLALAGLQYFELTMVQWQLDYSGQQVLELGLVQWQLALARLQVFELTMVQWLLAFAGLQNLEVASLQWQLALVATAWCCFLHYSPTTKCSAKNLLQDSWQLEQARAMPRVKESEQRPSQLQIPFSLLLYLTVWNPHLQKYKLVKD